MLTIKYTSYWISLPKHSSSLLTHLKLHSLYFTGFKPSEICSWNHSLVLKKIYKIPLKNTLIGTKTRSLLQCSKLISVWTNILKITVFHVVLLYSLAVMYQRFWKNLLPPSSGYDPDVGCTFCKMLVSTDYASAHLRKLYVILKSCVLVSSINNQVHYCFILCIRKHLMEQAKTEVNGLSLAQHILN